MQTKRQPDITPPLQDTTINLLTELNEVLGLLQKYADPKQHPDAEFALMRLIKGIPLESWHSIISRGAGQEWLALPVNRGEKHALQTMQRTLEQLFYQRDHDFLTGLGNRRLFDTLLPLELQRAKRTKTSVSIMSLDLDDFKKINDSYGHALGDEVLSRLGKFLSNSLRAYDTAIRTGGEEFCLLLPDTPSWGAKSVAKRILHGFRQERFTVKPGLEIQVSFSAGIAVYNGTEPTFDASLLLAQADEALYEAKRQGKNRFIMYNAPARLNTNPALVHADEKHFLFFGSTDS